MNLEQIVSTNFVLLQADWPVEHAWGLVESLPSARVIVQRLEGNNEYFYLRSHDETRLLLSRSQRDATVREAMDLYEWSAAPTRDALSDAEQAPDRCVVLGPDYVVGYFDIDEFAPSVMRGGLGGTIDQMMTAPDVAERSVAAEFPNTIALDQVASLTVALVGNADVPPVARIPLALPIGTVIDIIVQPKRGFVVEGPAEHSLTISDATETLPVQFKLRAKELGIGRIRVLAFSDGIAVGALTLAPTVEAPSPELGPTERGQQLAALAPISVRLPDLSLLIEETRVDGVRGFFMRITAADPNVNLNYMKYGPILFQTDPGTHFENLYAEIDDYSLQTESDRAIVVQQLATRGAFLFEATVPREARQKLWELREQIKTVIIQSEEPWIPWELCKMVGEENGSVVEGPFLCEAFALTRWIPGTGLKPALTLNRIALVVPSDSNLPYASAERDFMRSLATGSRQVTSVPAEYLHLYDALASGVYDGWHFTGHGGYRDPDPNRSAIYLEDGRKFSPYDLVGRAGNLGKTRPLVFLNACQAGRTDMALTDIGGWAAQFLRAGAGAFLGAYWSVYDKPAYAFAQELYGRLLAGLPIGQAAREARQAIRSTGDPSWLAYTIFADPLATVKS